MRPSLIAVIALLYGAAASAHQPGFHAIWLQPAAPIAIGGPILPLGYTHGLSELLDFTAELTPYGLEHDCGGANCRASVLGLIATAGVAFDLPLMTVNEWELGLFSGPKALVAAAAEDGFSGMKGRTFSFVPGTSYELGLGWDFGVELHSRPTGLYVALVVGMQVTKGFNYGHYGEDQANAPSWPLYMMKGPTVAFRRDDWSFLVAPNLNVLRIGWAF